MRHTCPSLTSTRRGATLAAGDISAEKVSYQRDLLTEIDVAVSENDITATRFTEASQWTLHRYLPVDQVGHAATRVRLSL